MSAPSGHSLARAFTLVEVVLAIAVVAFAVVPIVGLMAVGSDQYRGALDTTITAQIAQRVINDLQQADFRVLIDEAGLASAKLDSSDPAVTFRAPKVAQPALRYFDEQGNEIVPRGAGALSADERWRVLYHVNVRVRPRAELPRPRNALETGVAQVTVQVAHQAGAFDLEFDAAGSANANLFKPRPGLPIYTYSALVGRNE